MGFSFDNERLCIDFIATAFGPANGRVDLLTDSRSLSDWARAAGVVHGARALRWSDHERAISTRALIGRLISETQYSGRPPEGRLRHRINALARYHRPVLQLRGEDRVIRRGGCTELLAELATDTLDLLSQPDRLARVRWCAAEDCLRAFMDRSNGGRRRWCSKACRDRRFAAQRRRPRSAQPSNSSAAV